MLTNEELLAKWKDVLDHPDLPEITESSRKGITAQLLENTEKEVAAAGNANVMLSEAAPVNAMGAQPNANLKFQDPVLISMVRRAAPNLIANDIAGVQPMAGPSGLVFFMKAKYDTQGGTEALHNVANKTQGVLTGGAGALAGTGDSTAVGEGVTPKQMSFSIESASVSAKTRTLKADYSIELQQDMKSVHGLNAEKELTNILSTEIMAEINREVIDSINGTAKVGSQTNTAVAGTFNLDTDSNGRWMAEKFKGLMFHIDRESNVIATETRRGRGNIIVCSPDIASALAIAGKLDNTPALKNNLVVDATGNTFVGVLNSKYKVYIDPYATAEYMTIGYKGSSNFDAGIFYAPYVPMQLLRAVDELTFQPKIAFKTRYGMLANPFATVAQDGAINTANKDNVYYRRSIVSNIM